jgi:hypothetical protein
VALVHPLRYPLVTHNERRAVQLPCEIVVEVVSQAGSKWSPVRVQDHVAGPEMQNEAAKQESVGALEKKSGARGHLKALASTWSVREYLVPTRMTSTALSKGIEHGEHWPWYVERVNFDRALPCYPLLGGQMAPSVTGNRR